MSVEIIKDLIGKVAISVSNESNQELVFELENGQTATFFHEQQCCESVEIEEVIGDLDDLVGSEILQAEYVMKSDTSETWTFYKFATIKGSVTVRWYGESNGYYSETVHLKIDDNDGNYRIIWEDGTIDERFDDFFKEKQNG